MQIENIKAAVAAAMERQEWRACSQVEKALLALWDEFVVISSQLFELNEQAEKIIETMESSPFSHLTVLLGDGNTGISSVVSTDSDTPMAGVAFSVFQENESAQIGCVAREYEGLYTTDIDVVCQILSTRTESLDVLIDRLQEAKKLLQAQISEPHEDFTTNKGGVNGGPPLD